MSVQDGGQGIVPQPLAAGHLQAGEEVAVGDEGAPHLAGDEGVGVDLEVGEDRQGGQRLLTGDAVPTDGEAGEARAGEADEGEVDLTVVAAIAEQSQLPQLLAPELQDWGDVLETNTSHRQ